MQRGEDALSDYQHLKHLYNGAAGGNFKEYSKRCFRNGEAGIRFYVFEAPSKERIYGKYMPENIDVYGPKSRLDIIIPKLQEQGLPCMIWRIH